MTSDGITDVARVVSSNGDVTLSGTMTSSGTTTSGGLEVNNAEAHISGQNFKQTSDGTTENLKFWVHRVLLQYMGA